MGKSPDTISSLEQQVMLALLRLHPNGYGIAIRDELETRAGVRHAIGTIYAALDRLERKGFISQRTGEPTKERGGRAKLFFTLKGEGRKVLSDSMLALDALRRSPGGGVFARISTLIGGVI